jgi:hypothetical protein
MMKWGFALNATLGALLVASAIGVQKPGAQDLDLSLDRVGRGLEELAGLRARIERGDRAAIDEVIKRSEAPGTDPHADADRLGQLRFEVSRLQMDWDALAATLPVKTAPGPKSDGKPATTAVPGKGGPATTAFEAPGFSADPLRQGEALFRAGKYAESITVLRTQPDDPRCQYWNARALEQLGRIDEAVAIYTTVSARKDAGWAGERARTDLELIQWKREMDSSPSKPAPAPARPATEGNKPS